MDRHEAVPHGRRSSEIERVTLFSDAVFAIAITLLVLELKVPDPESIRSAGGLAAALSGEIPRFAAFFISFAAIGIYWIAHHRMFRYIRRCNEALIALNLLLLLFVAFLPFPVALFGSFRREPTAIAFYAISMTLTGLSLNLLWWYAAGRRRLVAPDLDRAIIRYVQFRAAAPPLVFALVLPFAFTHANWAIILWFLVFPLLRIVGGRFAREAREAERRSRTVGLLVAPAAVPAHASALPPAGPLPRPSGSVPSPPVVPAPGP